MKKLSIYFKIISFVLLFGKYSNITAQRYYSIVFNDLPVDMQLYPRNDKNEAIIPINGYIDIPNWKYISVVVNRNKVFHQYQRTVFDYGSSNNIGTFSLKPTIKSELAEYDISIYASREGKDSVLMVERKNIVGGDLYVIYGQSNARAWEEQDSYRNEFCRTYGYTSDNKTFTWGLSNAGFTGYDFDPQVVGQWGISIQRYIAEKYGIPTCVINEAPPGTPISALSLRYDDTPINNYSFYGRLLTYINGTKLKDNIKGFFYWQGEDEAARADFSGWKSGFDKLYKNLQIDLPNIQQFYVFQIPIFPVVGYYEAPGLIRNYQRLLETIYPKTTSYAPIGASDWDGFHFHKEGYTQIGNEIGKILSHDVYGNSKPYKCPSIQKAYYSTKNRDEITLVFEKGQQMVYPKDTLITNFINGGSGIYKMKDFFYINNVWKKVASGTSDGNRIVLTLKQPSPLSDSIIHYLPSAYAYAGGYEQEEGGENGNKAWTYKGPYLKNKDWFRAFAFRDVKIEEFKDSPLNKPELVATNILNDRITLQWKAIPNASKYILERKKIDGEGFQLIFESNIVTEFVDTQLNENQTYVYRLRARNEESESDYTTIEAKTSFLLNTNFLISSLPNFNVFPNPTSENIKILFNAPISGNLNLYDIMGNRKQEIKLKNQDFIELSIKNWKQGTYLIVFSNDTQRITKKIVKN